MIPDTSAMDRPVAKPKGLTRRHVVLLATGAVLAGGIALAVPSLIRWSRAERSVDASRLRTARVVRGDLDRDVAAQGRIVAALHPTLFSPAAGIVQLSVKAGTAVTKGQVLARVESPDLVSRLLQERSVLLSLRADLGRQQIAAKQAARRNRQAIDVLEVRLAAAERALERARSLYDQGLLNKTDFERAQDDVEIAGLELKNASEAAQLEQETLDFEVKTRAFQVERQEAIVRDTERRVDELAVRSPFEGMVATVDVQDRDAVAQSAPILTVVNLSEFEVEVEVPENYAADIVPGTRAEILYEGKTYPGRVTAISPEIRDSQVRSTVVFEGETPPNLRQSQRVTTRLVLDRRVGVLKVARGPFLESGAGRHAYVVEDGVAVRKEIEVGAVSVAEVEVVRGLAPGATIVISDTSLFEGARSVLLR
jgi:HlyD family secretion protein